MTGDEHRPITCWKCWVTPLYLVFVQIPIAMYLEIKEKFAKKEVKDK